MDNTQHWPKDTPVLALSELFSREQMQEIIRLHITTVGSPAKAFLAYIKSQPDIIERCTKKHVLPEYLAYYLEYMFAQRAGG